MHCLYAFLLIPREGLESTKRLAIMNSALLHPYYDIFIPKDDENFPVVGYATRIITTNGDINGPGTYARAYCSNTLSKHDLIKHVTKGLTSAYDNTHMGLGGADEAAEKCLGVIEALSRQEKESSQEDVSTTNYRQLSSSDSSDQSGSVSRKSRKNFRMFLGISSHRTEEPPKILLSKIRKMKVCSDLGLISLAYQKKIKITGFDSHFAPEYSQGQYEVVSDEKLVVEDIVFPGQMLAQTTCDGIMYALAWYMGHLHIFKRNNKKSQWWPETFIGLEKNNRRTILDIIAYHYKVIDPVMKIVGDVENFESNWRICGLNCCSSRKVFRQEEHRLIAQIRSLDLKKLPEMDENITE